mmetsp:Transcript_107088/g.276869  ORF Transcript_107088/g.276869 Transcript_107088/m.276869 type:complete len:320 (+) Transcript_107088:299-1258(+)
MHPHLLLALNQLDLNDVAEDNFQRQLPNKGEHHELQRGPAPVVEQDDRQRQHHRDERPDLWDEIEDKSDQPEDDSQIDADEVQQYPDAESVATAGEALQKDVTPEDSRHVLPDVHRLAQPEDHVEKHPDNLSQRVRGGFQCARNDCLQGAFHPGESLLGRLLHQVIGQRLHPLLGPVGDNLRPVLVVRPTVLHVHRALVDHDGEKGETSTCEANHEQHCDGPGTAVLRRATPALLHHAFSTEPRHRAALMILLLGVRGAVHVAILGRRAAAAGVATVLPHIEALPAQRRGSQRWSLRVSANVFVAPLRATAAPACTSTG